MKNVKHSKLIVGFYSSRVTQYLIQVSIKEVGGERLDMQRYNLDIFSHFKYESIHMII